MSKESEVIDAKEVRIRLTMLQRKYINGLLNERINNPPADGCSEIIIRGFLFDENYEYFQKLGFGFKFLDHDKDGYVLHTMYVRITNSNLLTDEEIEKSEVYAERPSKKFVD